MPYSYKTGCGASQDDTHALKVRLGNRLKWLQSSKRQKIEGEAGKQAEVAAVSQARKNQEE
jgi:hypothetical protein